MNGESKTIELGSVATAVKTLHTAEKYLCDGLLKLCVSYLSSQLNTENVFQILQAVRIYVEATNPDALVLKLNQDQQNTPFWRAFQEDPKYDPCVKLSAQLIDNCLEFIDKNATAVLSTEVIELLKGKIDMR